MYQKFGKRLIDIALTVSAITFTLPLFLLMALLIRWRLGSPIIFRQTRPGHDGRLFTLYKFRTMTDAYDSRGNQLSDTQRITELGRFLRSTSMDELPELWNVIRGDMSLVGPRPLLLEYLDCYTPEQNRRHGVLPGITGWAQINGRNEIDWEKRFEFDVWYVDHLGIWLDLKILLLSIGRVLRREGISEKGHISKSKFQSTHKGLPTEAIVLPHLSGNMQKSSDTQLACDGGKPIRTTPFAPWPAFGEEEVNAVADVLRSGKVNYWTGDEGRKFESEFSQFVGAKHAVTVTNGTVALELALRAIGIGPGDEVVVTSRTFIASASCIIAVGAKPMFADVDSDSQNITAASVRAVLTANTKAIITVHLAGWPCAMDSILALAHAHDIKVVEDCAQALGATYRGAQAGTMGDVAAFSFCQDKIMTTGGEGGMLVTNDDEIWQRAWSYKDHGKSWNKVYQRDHPPGFRWLHDSFGSNGRMTEIQAAIGRISLRRLPLWLTTRRRYALKLTNRLGRLTGLQVTSPPDDIDHAYYKYYFFVDINHLRSGWDRDRIMNAISAEGIPCYSGSCPEIYLEDAFPKTMRPSESLPQTRAIGASSLMVLVHPTLSDIDIEDTCLAIEKVMRAASHTVRQPAAA